MIVIPAIDLHEGQVVRLRKGVFEDVTFYGKDPSYIAKSFVDAGAERIHVVDLDGSLRGKGVNTAAIGSICSSVNVEVELGGGIRSEEDVLRAFDTGVTHVILGTMVVKQPVEARKIIEGFPGRVGIGIDAQDGMVAVHGWKEITDVTAVSVAKEYEDCNPAFIVYTDINRDGMLTGPNIEVTEALVDMVHTPVVASGGVGSLEDILALLKVDGLMGVITGKAIYEGRINLKEAFDKTKIL